MRILTHRDAQMSKMHAFFPGLVILDEWPECKSIEDEIHELEAEIQKRQDVLDAKWAERAPFAPAYALPDEMWLEILERAFLHRFPRCGNPRSTFTGSPIAFSHVSRRFRELALALPSIWTCLHVNPRQSFTYSCMLHEQLLRSKDMLISVTFICRDPGGRYLSDLGRSSSYEFTNHFKECWYMLLPHASRWRHLSFWVEDKCTDASLLVNFGEWTRSQRVLTAAADTLSVLVLNTIDLLDVNESEVTSTTSTLPKLHHVVLRDVDPTLCMRLLSFRAPKITLLEIEPPYSEDDNFMSPVTRNSSIVLPEVKKLHLYTPGRDTPIPLFEPTFLEFFPGLEHIIVREDGVAVFTVHCLSALLQSLEEFERDGRQLPPLKKLWISEPGPLQSEIEDALAQVIRRKEAIGSPFDEVLMLVDTSRSKESAATNEGQETRREEQAAGGGRREENEENTTSRAWEYVEDDWIVSARGRKWGWQTSLDCPALPCWEPGADSEVSWVRKPVE
ncbi:hypothetical protein EIP86_007346 [Pleurotus ostreatoroseus]|nr:hypothetical protein EIP86_007346 [Pleurotus ostreatoroseus]